MLIEDDKRMLTEEVLGKNGIKVFLLVAYLTAPSPPGKTLATSNGSKFCIGSRIALLCVELGIINEFLDKVSKCRNKYWC